MKKELIIGIAAVATAGAIIGAVTFSETLNPFDLKESENTNEQDKQKIEQLYLDELQDEKKYGFCMGEAQIHNNYEDLILNNTGILQHNSDELLVYDKEANKFFVLARKIDYKYKGQLNTNLGGLTVSVPVSEHGSLAETYAKNKMPVRIDYSNSYIMTDPATKQSSWVYSVIGEESEMVMPRTGCSGTYKLDNSPGKDLLVGSDQIIIERDCDEKDINGSYEGVFSYKCYAIDYRQAMDMLDNAKTEEELQNTKDTSTFESQEADEETVPDVDGSQRDIGGKKSNINLPIPEEDDSDTLKSEDMQKIMEQLKKEMDASQKAE